MEFDASITAASKAIDSSRRGGAARLEVRCFFDEPTFTASYCVHDPASGKAAIIDSVCDFDQPSGRTSFQSADAIVAYAKENQLSVEWLLETHAHADHLSAAPYLQEKLGGKIAIGAKIKEVQVAFSTVFNEGRSFPCDGSQFDHLFEDGDRFMLGQVPAMSLHVPGHTPACMAYVIGDAVFVGDTLFMPDYGSARADFPGGDARKLYRSIRRLMQLPDETRVFVCHDYQTPQRSEFNWETTMGDQRTGNIHVHEGIAEDGFVAMRTRRDATLGMPKLILPSIQVNIRAGHLPEPENNGTRYLKLPLNLL